MLWLVESPALAEQLLSALGLLLCGAGLGIGMLWLQRHAFHGPRPDADSDPSRADGNRDFLTGLPNRIALRDELQMAIAVATMRGRPFSVLMLDLDRFKPINDRHGHISGDKVLQEIAQRIAATIAPGDVCARYGGDEFVVIARQAGDDDAKLDYGARLIDALSRPVIVGGQSFQVGASIGMACYPIHGTGEDDLLRRADLALYQAKQGGRGATRMYHGAMETDLEARHAAEVEIRNAIADGQIIPHFQPIVDVATRRIRGFEALARWQHPTRGMIAPMDFIPIAESAGELGNLTMSILRQACIDARDLPADITIAVNISPQQFQDEWLSTKILKVLTETGFPPHRLEVELTENALVTDFAAAKRVIHSLQNLGIGIALDDFGTGYSSLFYLSELQFDKIKIDRSFVRSLHDRSESAKIINAIIGLGRSLGVPTMAEGVETERDAAVLGQIGCLTAQGYLYSRPVPADQMSGLLAATATEKTATAA
jgi:diguanylate cyclase (GGDEF)-like protein